ncbi:hypothetical protein BZL29_2997 [Mycobacterium kansasii]|uniref:Uncharacterized protein n=1 Tax=Mycobacterium kansasii TaxID=1768 RepID=A0A1V3XD05_MYCKA|nr:hypothetical protein BZL29_2997 [Mycobacterium kansasii]
MATAPPAWHRLPSTLNHPGLIRVKPGVVHGFRIVADFIRLRVPGRMARSNLRSSASPY